MGIALQMLISLGTKLLTEALLEELLIFTLEKMAKLTKSKVDDELVDMIKKHLDK
jgi:hypothetical protein